MDRGLVSLALMWLVVAATAMSAAASILVLGHKGMKKGLGAVAVGLLLVALLALMRVLSAQQAGWNGLLLGSLLFSAALNALVIALRQFRQLDIDWRWLALAPAAVMALGSIPLLGTEPAPWLLHAMAAVFIAQTVWAAVELWRMRALQLGVGYQMLCLAVGLFALGMVYLQCALGQGLALESPQVSASWYWVRTLLMVVVMLLLSLGFMRMVQDRREARSRRAALRDPLTRMLNRRALVRALEHCITDASRQSKPLALLLIDVDHFKRVNDTHGHISGDKVLRHVSRVLASNVRTDASVGRFGGEEFVIICPGCGMEDAHTLALRLNEAVRASSIPIQGQTLRVTVSIGGYAGAVAAGTPWETLLEAADSAMDRAKDTGRDRVVMHRELPAAAPQTTSAHWQQSHA